MKRTITRLNARMTSRHKIRAYLMVVLAAGVLTSCYTKRGPVARMGGIACETVDNIELPGESRRIDQKMIVATFRFRGKSPEVRETLVTFAKGRTPISQGCNFSFVLVGTENELLARYGILDPNIQVVEAPGRVVRVRETYFSARFPFSPRAREIQVLDENEKLVTKADLIPAIRDFCLSQKFDKECQLVKHVP